MSSRRELPAVTGKQLIKLLKNDGWAEGRIARHGKCLTKKFSDRTRVTFVPNTRASLPPGTLSDILSVKQTGLGKFGLLKLIDKYGI